MGYNVNYNKDFSTEYVNPTFLLYRYKSYSSITAGVVILFPAAYYSNTDYVYITHAAYRISLPLHL